MICDLPSGGLHQDAIVGTIILPIILKFFSPYFWFFFPRVLKKVSAYNIVLRTISFDSAIWHWEGRIRTEASSWYLQDSSTWMVLLRYSSIRMKTSGWLHISYKKEIEQAGNRLSAVVLTIRKPMNDHQWTLIIRWPMSKFNVIKFAELYNKFISL